MDNRKWEADAAAAPPGAPASPSDGYPTNGNALTATPATEPGEWWFHAIGEELRAVIADGGLTPNINTLTQVRDAIRNMIKGGDYKDSVRVASTVAINLAAPGANIDGVAMVAGDRFLEKNHGTPALRGIYIWNGAAVAATRATDADDGAELNDGALIPVEQGTVNADTTWRLTSDGTVTIGTTALTFVQKDPLNAGGYMLVRDEKAQNTPGGASIVGTQIRALNTVVANTISGASLTSNQITLPAGTYRVNAWATVRDTDRNRAFIYNVTDAATLSLGSSEDATTVLNSRSTINDRFTLAATKVLELRHYTQLAVASNGLGLEVNNGGVEVYSTVEIIKE